MNEKIRLGVNIDHIATLRQQRYTPYPDMKVMAATALQAGADHITLHLREDRRHIQDEDVYALQRLLMHQLQKEMNLEMALTREMLHLAHVIQPHWVCLVPEKRQELTTEGGLDVVHHHQAITVAIKDLQRHHIQVSLFIDPDLQQVRAAIDCAANAIELHTGTYAKWVIESSASDGIEHADHTPRSYCPKTDDPRTKAELQELSKCAAFAHEAGIRVHAGHGLTRDNVAPIAQLPQLRELNIGHAIVCDALMFGWQGAIQSMRQAIDTASCYPSPT